MAKTRDILTSPRVLEIKHKRRIKRMRLIILILIFIILVIFGLSTLSQYKKIDITNVVVSGTRIINADDVKENIKNDLSGKYLYLFSKNNSLIYPKQYIYNNLLKNFPRIDTLVISRDKVNTLKIVITERYGSYLWCGNTIPDIKTEVGENCYFINNDGYIFDKAPYFSGNLYFKFYIPLANNPAIPLGIHMLPTDDFHLFLRFIDSVTSMGLKPIYLIFNSDGTRELYLEHTNSTVAPKIIFKDDADLEDIASDLSSAMAKTEFAEEIKNKYDSLLYIDMRFKNKVLYKFK